MNNLGVVLKEQGKLKEAIEIFDKVISLEPNSSATYNNM
ncbi:MAG: tetratricopeptide repeat protein [Alphaproteobacteria bacterium]|nr:MAG: tetratricopeptide repeat protein [Alphaproteobacteria bacterium]